LVRSLAVSIATLDEDKLPLSFDYDFMMTLDTNLSEQDKICAMADVYECAWWNMTNPKSLDLAEILDKSSLEKCLDTHMKQIVGPIKSLTESTPLATSTSLTSSASSARLTKSAAHTLQEEKIPSPLPVKPATGTCEKCEEYSDILSNTLLDVVNIHTFAQMMLTSSETQWNIDMRRASTFNLLHEASVIKEMAGPSSATSVTPMGVDSVARTAAQELQRLKQLPPTSHKWTWGECLTKTEVLGLGRSGTDSKLSFHSGYDQSLIDGDILGINSSLPSMPVTMDVEDILSDAARLPPDSKVQDIVEFERMGSRFYDPLGKKRESHIFLSDPPAQHSAVSSHFSPKRHNLLPCFSANLTEDNLFLHTINAEASSHRGTPAFQDTEERESLAGDKGVVMSTAVGIEDAWSSDSNGSVMDKFVIDSTTVPCDRGTQAVAIEDEWPAETDDMAVQTPGRVVELGEPSTFAVEDLWVADDTNDDEEVGDRPGTGIGASADLEVPAIGVEDEWISASDDELPTAGDSNYSSQPTVNSQVMVSPSRITMQNVIAPFPLSDLWPDLDSQDRSAHRNSTLEIPAPGSFRQYGPEDFKNLTDCMFEDKLSESDYSEEEDD
jgi:hypothetical protein